jgi:hypothetical protein
MIYYERPRCEIPGERKQMYTQVQDRQAGRRVGEGKSLKREASQDDQQLEERPQVSCHIRNHEGKREQSGKGGMQAEKTW